MGEIAEAFVQAARVAFSDVSWQQLDGGDPCSIFLTNYRVQNISGEVFPRRLSSSRPTLEKVLSGGANNPWTGR